MVDDRYWRQTLRNGMTGEGAHVHPANAFEALDWQLAGEVPQGVEYSIWQLLDHMIYWQEFTLNLLRGESVQTPEHAADSWTTDVGPASTEQWNAAVQTFLQGVRTTEQFISDELGQTITARPELSRSEEIGMLIGHNSYHLGQVVLIRRMLGAWPPPSGGDTW